MTRIQVKEEGTIVGTYAGGLSGLEAISEAGKPGHEYLELSWLVDWLAPRDVGGYLGGYPTVTHLVLTLIAR
ncbi:hypothetical protein IFM47457_04253 [Aspergillus lentulus]|nr:hypothetical protein IFM47457_04253 [Aspergillus lentulus]